MTRTLSRLAPLLLLAAAACRGGGDQTRKARPIPVRTAQATARTASTELRVIGRIVSNRSVALRPQVSGTLVAARFTEGQVVQEGQVLLEIDPRPYQAALAEARARREQEAVRAETAKRDAERLTELAGKDFVTKQQYDAARAAAAGAVAAVAAADAAVARAALNLGWCTLRAPVGGRTGRLLVHPGNVVQAGGPEPLVTIEQTRPVFAAFAIPERHLSLLRARGAAQPVRVRPSGGPEVTGNIDFVDNAVDPGTATILLKARLANEDESLWPGQLVDAVVSLAERKDAVAVPASAVSQGQQGEYLFVVKADKTVELRPVTVEQALEDYAVIGRGLAAGETVVTEGQIKLVPGALVEPIARAEGK
jgi:membrane fusion protein, multidrug efflux system